MLNEQMPQIDLDAFVDTGVFLERLDELKKGGAAVVTLTASVDWWEELSEVLCSFRSENVSVVLLLRRTTQRLETGQISFLFSLLRRWDQMLLCNFLELCEDRLPPEYLEAFRAEAKIELKWFTEWLMASTDSRLNRYPTLPWRSFIRKIVGENYAFASDFIANEGQLIEAMRPEEVALKIQAFLESKKKVLCLFPKRWGRA